MGGETNKLVGLAKHFGESPDKREFDALISTGETVSSALLAMALQSKGIKAKSTKIARDRQFKRQSKMDDDNPAAYKPAPGDKDAKTKPSVHTRKFKKMFGEGEATKQAKARIDAEKARDKIRFDRMRDMARTRDANTKNRATE